MDIMTGKSIRAFTEPSHEHVCVLKMFNQFKNTLVRYKTLGKKLVYNMNNIVRK